MKTILKIIGGVLVAWFLWTWFCEYDRPVDFAAIGRR